MGELRDYQEWHHAYDDPDSGLSWRLRTVQRYIREMLDERPGPLRVLSLCSGDGRDLIEVLSERADADRVEVTLVELHPEIAEAARANAATAGLHRVQVLTADAGNTDLYAAAVPADLVLLMGIFGNISNTDLAGTIAAAPQLCRPGATVLWSRGRFPDDLNNLVRDWFTAAEFVELDYATKNFEGQGDWPALGAVRFAGEPADLVPGRQLFTFLR